MRHHAPIAVGTPAPAGPHSFPPGLRATIDGRRHTFSYCWAGPDDVLVLAVGIGLALFFAAVLPAMTRGPSTEGPFIVMVCTLAAMAMTVTGLAGLVNRTYIDVDDDCLTVRHGPLPWVYRKGVLPLATVDRVTVTCLKGAGDEPPLYALDIAATPPPPRRLFRPVSGRGHPALLVIVEELNRIMVQRRPRGTV